jgi:uncharacterized protein
MYVKMKLFSKNKLYHSEEKVDRDFYKMLHMQSEKTLEGVEHLYSYINKNIDAEGDRVIEIEKEADELRRILISALDQTFITPFEREDIYNLSRTIDDVIDYSESTVEELRLFKLDRDENLKRMVEILLEETKALESAVKYLRFHKSISSEQLVKAKMMENEMEVIYRKAIVELLDKDDFKYIFKMREIYRHMSNAADRGDEAANIIGHIIIKTT